MRANSGSATVAAGRTKIARSRLPSISHRVSDAGEAEDDPQLFFPDGPLERLELGEDGVSVKLLLGLRAPRGGGRLATLLVVMGSAGAAGGERLLGGQQH